MIKCPDFSETTIDIINYIVESKKNIVYIIGNHDQNISSFASKKISNIKFCTKYSFEYEGRSYFITHGDNYDSGLVKLTFLMKAISLIQNFIEERIGINLGSIWAKLINKKNMIKSFWSIVDSNIDYDVTIIGHLHKPEVLIWVDERVG